ncbi:MAG TPA: alpha/beta hydrolase [Candidatus Sulfotelmatobacter sp.]|nr:alpha/beta hydrolase [Candidatus Sulfotelmatobacter sp.]
MNYERITTLTATDGHNIPAYLFSPDTVRAGAAVIPGYGGTKEQMLGIAVALGNAGIAALSIDPCGHGENRTPIGPLMCDEVESAVRYVRRFGRTSAIGISLGGRLALMSSADCMVAISPSVVAEVSPQGKWMFENFPSPAVREPYSGYVIELLQILGPVPSHDRPCLLLYAERDIPAIMEGAPGLKAALPKSDLRYVTTDLRPDIKHDNGLIRYLPRWFNHGELKFNNEVLTVTAAWLAERCGQAQNA